MKFTTVVTLLLLVCNLFANDQLFKEANDAFMGKDYDGAIAKYEALLTDGLSSVELHFNLATSYYKINELGKSVLNYEKALKLKPGHKDSQFNLAIVEDNLVDDMEALPPFFLTKWWNTLRDLLSSTIWSIIALIMLWISVFGWVKWFTGEDRVVKKKGFLIGVSCLLLCLIPFFLARSSAQFESEYQAAVILEKVLELRTAPDEASAPVVELHEGTKVNLLDKIEDWYKVRLKNGEVGWLNEKQLGLI